MTLPMNINYDITYNILELIASISEKIGATNALHLNKQSPQLKKQNKIKVIQTYFTSGNDRLTEKQIATIIDRQPIDLPERKIKEVLNTLSVYDSLKNFDLFSEQSFLSAHRQLMDHLVDDAGRYRNKNTLFIQDEKLKYKILPASKVQFLMSDLFSYLQKNDELLLIKSCVFYYKIISILPFSDGNDRVGRFWQSLILKQKYPIFEFLTFENSINGYSEDFHIAFDKSIKSNNLTSAIEFMLGIIDYSLGNLLNFKSRTLTELDRIFYFLELGNSDFDRKEYMNVFKDISSATASRDLKKALLLGCIRKSGEKNQTRYSIK